MPITISMLRRAAPVVLAVFAGCGEDPVPVVRPAETPLASVGCKHDPPVARPLPRLAADAPARPLPFFAARSGVLPPDGPATIGGVPLPPGARCAHHWATDDPVPDPLGVASRLAAVFPQTGLWPILWDINSDDPDTYPVLEERVDTRAIGEIDPARVLADSWQEHGFEGDFVGLAQGTPPAPVNDPFRRQVGVWPFGTPPRGGWRIVLVPVNRPADAVAVLDHDMTDVMSDEAVSAVLRSWEERFGAVLTNLSAGVIGVVADRPPPTDGDAMLLAQEQAALAPEDDAVIGPAAISRLASALHGGQVAPGVSRSQHFWILGWPD